MPQHFSVVMEQKAAVRRALLKDQSVVDLLCNTGNNVEEFTHFNLGSKSPAADLIKTHFFVPSTQTGDKNYITMQSNVYYTTTAVIKATRLTIYVICNLDQMDLLQGSRADLLADAVDHLINRERDLFGMGGIQLRASDEVQFNESYYGWSIPYVTHERNREGELL